MDDNGKSSDRKVGSFRPSGGIGLAFLVAVLSTAKISVQKLICLILVGIQVESFLTRKMKKERQERRVRLLTLGLNKFGPKPTGLTQTGRNRLDRPILRQLDSTVGLENLIT